MSKRVSLLAAALVSLPSLALAADAKTTPAPAASSAPAAAPTGKQIIDVKPASPVDEGSMPEIVAKVNGVDIKKADLQNAVETVKAQMQMVGQAIPEDRKDEMYRGLLDDLIATELLAQEASTRKIAVADKDVDDFIATFKAKFPTEEVFQRAIKEQGITEAQLKSDVRKQLSIKKLLDKEVMSKVAVDDAAVQKFYKENPDKFQEPEQVHAQHVLIGVDKNADDKTRADKKKLADQVLKDAKGGKDFGGLAKQYSDDPGSKDKGGDLGFFPKGEMVPAFEDAAFKLKPGEISDIIETPYGFHIIKVLEKKPAHVVPLEDEKQDITDFLKDKKAGDLAKTFVDTLRKKAKVQVFI